MFLTFRKLRHGHSAHENLIPKAAEECYGVSVRVLAFAQPLVSFEVGVEQEPVFLGKPSLPFIDVFIDFYD